MAWPSAVAPGTGILFLHFVAIASMTIIRSSASTTAYRVDLGTVGSIVVFTGILIVAVALFLSYQSQNSGTCCQRDGMRLGKALRIFRQAYHITVPRLS
ncbi:MAG: hypothetical protein V7704_06115 [Aurantimonas endophytica]